MNIKRKNRIFILLLLLALVWFPSCGAVENEPISISGAISLDTYVSAISYYSPVYVIISRTMNMDRIAKYPETEIVSYVLADRKDSWDYQNTDLHYNIDLTDSDVKTGDKLFVIAFIENEKSGKVLPVPSVDDYVGLHIHEQDRVDGIPCPVKSGENPNINIEINKIYVDINASISGTIDGDGDGNLLLVAFRDSTFDATNTDIDNFDVNSVIAFSEISKTSGVCEYTLNILPFFRVGLFDVSLPIKDVTVFVLLDKDGNGVLDSGEKLGFYRNGGAEPVKFDLDSGDSPGIDITLDRDYYPNETSVGGEIQGVPNGSTVTVIAYAGNEGELYPTTLAHENIIGFSVVKNEDEEVGDDDVIYKIDMLPFSLFPRDNVSFFVIEDTNDNRIPDQGERIGFYIDMLNISTRIPVPAEGLTGVDIKLDKTYNEHDVSITGTLQGNITGNITLIAYIGIIQDEGVENFDVNKVAGYGLVQKETTASVPYSLKILPHISIPPEGVTVSLFALQDVIIKNNKPDEGEVFGMYIDTGTMKETFMVNAAGATEKHIILDKTYHAHTVTVTGELTGDATGNITIVAYRGYLDENGLGETYDINNVIAYTMINKSSPGSIPYTLKVLNHIELPVDGVSVFALRDTNLDRLPTHGELVGYYRTDYNLDASWTYCSEENDNCTFSGTMEVRYGAENSWFIEEHTDGVFCDNDEFGDPINGTAKHCETRAISESGSISAEIEIPGSGEVAGIDINFNKTYYNYGSPVKIEGNIDGVATGKVSVIAYAGELVGASFDDFDFDYVLAYTTVTKDDTTVPYSITVFPLFELPMEKVSLFAIVESDNGVLGPDEGETLGFYQDSVSQKISFPVPVEGATGIDVTLDRKFFTNDISVQGRITVSSSAGSVAGSHALLLIAYTGDLDALDMDSFDYKDVVMFKVCGVQSYPYDYDETILPFDFQGLPNGVNVFAVIDVDDNGMPTAGDRMGLYLDSNLNSTVNLTSGNNPGIDIKINKIMNDYDRTFKFYLDPTPSGSWWSRIVNKDVVFLLVDEVSIETNFLGIFTNLRDLDRYTVGMTRTVVDLSSSMVYSVSVAPVIDDTLTLPHRVILFMMVDENQNGIFARDPDDDPFAVWPDNDNKEIFDVDVNSSVTEEFLNPNWINF